MCGVSASRITDRQVDRTNQPTRMSACSRERAVCNARDGMISLHGQIGSSKMNKIITLFAVLGMVFALAPAAYAAPVTDLSLFTPVPTGPYRIAFVTSTTAQPTNSAISWYNDFVTTAAGLITELDDLGATWKCLGSTVAVSAKVNTSTDSTDDANDVPIYTTTGLLIATNNADLWDGAIGNPIYFDNGDVAGVEGGAQEQTWTGTNPDGTSASSGDGRELGSGPSPNNVRLVRGGGTDGNWISSVSDHDASAKHYLALSSPIPPPSSALCVLSNNEA
jgi:hypothetical protein